MQLMIRVGTSRMAERRADGVDQSRSPAATSPCRAGLVILLALSVRTTPVCSLLRRLGILDILRDQPRPEPLGIGRVGLQISYAW